MADEGVRRLLRDLQLKSVIPVFKENKITMNALPLLTEKQIKQLLPVLGEQVVFLKYWRENIRQKASKQTSSKKRVHGDSGKNDVAVVLEVHQPEKKAKPSAVYEVPTSNSMKMSGLSIRDMISRSAKGKTFLRIYDSLPEDKKMVTDTHRNIICSAICEECENRGIQMDTATAYVAAKMIVEVFPSEALSTYFLPPVKKCNSSIGKSLPAKGKLLMKWRSMQTSNKKLNAQLGKTSPKVKPKVVYKVEQMSYF